MIPLENEVVDITSDHITPLTHFVWCSELITWFLRYFRKTVSQKTLRDHVSFFKIALWIIYGIGISPTPQWDQSCLATPLSPLQHFPFAVFSRCPSLERTTEGMYSLDHASTQKGQGLSVLSSEKAVGEKLT